MPQALALWSNQRSVRLLHECGVELDSRTTSVFCIRIGDHPEDQISQCPSYYPSDQRNRQTFASVVCFGSQAFLFHPCGNVKQHIVKLIRRKSVEFGDQRTTRFRQSGHRSLMQRNFSQYWKNVQTKNIIAPYARACQKCIQEVHI